MKIHEYNQMMAYLTRPPVRDPESMNQGPRTADLFNQGGRVGLKDAGLVKPVLYQIIQPGHPEKG